MARRRLSRGFEKKLRSTQTYWGVPLVEHARAVPSRSSSRFRNTSWTEPEQTLVIACAREVRYASPSNSGPPLSRCICLPGTPTAGRTGNPERTPPGSIHLAGVEVGCCESQFIPSTKSTIAVIYSRSQETQVYADFSQPLRALDSTVSMQPIPANILSVPELMHAVHTANTDIIALIRRRK